MTRGDRAARRAVVDVYEGASASAVGPARARTQLRSGLLLTLTDADGLTGQGEAAPLPAYDGATLVDVRAALDAAAEQLSRAGRVVPGTLLAKPWVRELPGCARFAVEVAVLDLEARRRGVPLRRMLRPRGAMVPVPVSAYVGAALDAGLAARANDAVARGVGTLKVKLGGTVECFDAEVAAVAALRDEVPGAWRLRLDLNGAWTAASAAPARLAALAALDAEFVEQPFTPGSVPSLPFRWAADESMGVDGDVRAVLRAGASRGVVAVVLKPAALGLLRAWELASRARAAGLAVVVTHLFDGPIGLAAACELALALPSVGACGLDLHAGLAAWPARDVPQRASAAYVVPGAGVGHGIASLPSGRAAAGL